MTWWLMSSYRDLRRERGRREKRWFGGRKGWKTKSELFRHKAKTTVLYWKHRSIQHRVLNVRYTFSIQFEKLYLTGKQGEEFNKSIRMSQCHKLPPVFSHGFLLKWCCILLYLMRMISSAPDWMPCKLNYFIGSLLMARRKRLRTSAIWNTRPRTMRQQLLLRGTY